MSIQKAENVSTNEIQFSPIKTNNYGGKFASVTYKGAWMSLQTPTKMRAPFGMKVYENRDPKTGELKGKSFVLPASFSGYEIDESTGKPKNQKMGDFYKLMCDMEKKLIKHASKNGLTWIGDEDASEPVCKALLRTSVNWSKDPKTKKINKQYAPTIKLNLPIWEGKMRCKVFLDGRDHEIRDVDELVKRTTGRLNFTAIIKCDKVSFNGGKYGFKWSIQQLKLYTTSNKMDSYAFLEASDEEDEEEDEVVDKRMDNQVVDSSDEEDDDEEEKEDVSDDESSDDDSLDESSEEKPPTPKKKRGRRKKSDN